MLRNISSISWQTANNLSTSYLMRTEFERNVYSQIYWISILKSALIQKKLRSRIEPAKLIWATSQCDEKILPNLLKDAIFVEEGENLFLIFHAKQKK